MTNEDLERAYHRMRDKLGLELHRFVRDEAEDVEKFRRRFHIHLCLLTVNGVVTYLSLVGIVSITLVTGCTTGVLVIQEYVDRIGRF